MKYSLIDRGKAPQPKAKPASAAALFDGLVASLVPGKAARVEPTGKGTPRGLKASITRAAERAGRRVRSRDADGKVYAELVEGAPPPAAGAPDA